MTNFKLTSHIITDRLPGPIQAIQAHDAKGDLVCIIFVDGRLSPQAEDFSIEELEHFIFIAKKFHTFFEILEETAQKEELLQDREALIRQLETEKSFIQ